MKHKEQPSITTSLVLNTGLTALEIVTGLLIGSLALMADGYKNLTDSILLIVALFAEKLGNRKGLNILLSRRNAAIFNIVVVLLVALYLMYSSIQRLKQPTVTHGLVIVVVGSIAIAVNLVAAIIIRAKKQIASRAAYFGLLSSAVSGASVLISGVLVSVYHIRWVDGVAGLLIATLLVLIAFKLSKDNIRAQ